MIPILDSLIQEYPSRVIVDSVVETCKGQNLVCVGLSEVVECYVEKGLYMEGLEVYRDVLGFGFVPGIRCCNGLLGVLERVEELELGLCLCGSLMRIGVEFDVATWGNVARMLNKAGRMEAVVRLLDSGFCSWAIYDLVIDYYSKCVKFEAAFARIDEMRGQKIEPGFIAYSSILDGACRFGDVEVIETVMGIMTEKKLLQGLGNSKYDRVIKRLSNSGRTHASEMLYKRARDEGVGLEAATLGCMLSAFSKGGRMKEAVWIYGIISETGIFLDSSYFQAFVELLCQEIPSKEMNNILICMIKRGVHPHDEELANLITWHCKKGQLKETEDLVNAVIEEGFLPQLSCCRALVKHYCYSGEIDSGMSLHQKLEKRGVVLDVATYNQLLRGLFCYDRVEDASRVFDYMRRNAAVSIASFLVMISGLCGAKEKRKAMQLHDDMLKMGLKPNAKTYRSLISVFS